MVGEENGGFSVFVCFSMWTRSGSTLPVTEFGMVMVLGAWKPGRLYSAGPFRALTPEPSPFRFLMAFLSFERSS